MPEVRDADEPPGRQARAARHPEEAAPSTALDGVLELVFACPGCGWIDSRREDGRVRRPRRSVAMRVLDPRLLRRARAARMLLVVDAALAVVMALLVLAQAVLLARVAARSFEGASLDEVATPLVLLVGVGRGAPRRSAPGGSRSSGRRAAGDVISQLRLDVVETRLRRQPAALDGRTERGGRDRRRLRRGRTRDDVRALPAAGRARGRRARRGTRARRVDRPPRGRGDAAHAPARARCSCGSSVGTRSAARASAGRRSRSSRTHFLDVVRGLPTLRAFNRSHAQAGASPR